MGNSTTGSDWGGFFETSPSGSNPFYPTPFGLQLLAVNDATGALSLIGAEAALGNPSVNGYVLSSTTSGVRSWIGPAAASFPSQGGHAGQFLTTDGTNVSWAASGGGTYYNVQDYGAVGDGSTDDTAAITATITAIPATGGVLYFPATSSGYKTSGGFTLSKPIAVVGDGMVTTSNVTATWTVKPTNAFTQIRCTSATAVVFTVSSAGCSFYNIAFFNVAGSTPSAGSAIYVSNHGEMMRIANVFTGGFYDNIDFAEGANWNIAGSFFYGPVRYGLRIRNTSNSDAGDQSIVNTSFYADNYDATSAIRYESGGGLKLTNVKINRGAGDKSFSNGVDCAFGAGVASGILLISNSSIENYTGHGVKLVATASGAFGKVQISNSEFLNASSNTTGSGIYADGSAGTLTNFIITGCAFQGGGPAAVALTSVSFASLSNNQNIGFTARLTQSGCNSVLDLDAFFYGGQLLNYGFTISNGTPPTTLPDHVRLWLRDTGSSTGVWNGRGAFGGDNTAVSIGEYDSKTRIAGLNAALDAYADLYIQPGTSGATLHLGVAGGSPVSIEGPLTVPAGSITDAMAALAVKPAVAVVATSNLTLSGEQTIDGVTTNGSLVLATAQSTGSQNGPWVSASGSWARPTWYATGSSTQAPQFLTTFVRLGTTYQGSTWRMTTAAVTIGTTSTTWTQTPISLASSNVTGTLPVANGGTAIASYAVGDLLYASGSTSLSKLADVATGSVLVSGGITTAPAWSATPTFSTLTLGSTTSLLLGTAGSAVGNIGFRNATSGTATLAPPTGALGTYTITLPNAASTLPIFGQQITFAGPTAARTITLPDASFTAARTDAANTFTGVQTMTSPALTTPAITTSAIVTSNGLATSTTDGLVIQNTTAGIGGTTDQYSPQLRWTGHLFYSSADHTHDFRAFMQTVSGGSLSQWILNSRIDGGSYGNGISLTTGGTFTVPTLNMTSAQFTSSTKIQNDSDGAVRILSSGNNLATLGFASLVLNKTSNYGMSVNDSMNTLTNAGAAGEVDFTLPASPTVGLTYVFYVSVAQTLKVIANTGQTIRVAGSVSASAGNITSATIGDSISIRAVTTTSWITTCHEGTWTVT